MNAAVVTEYQSPLDMMNVDAPSKTRNGAIVKILACGICRTDWHAWQGNAFEFDTPQILGHEPVGIVIETGEHVDTVVEGERTVIPFNICCGTCLRCRNGHENMCDNLKVLGCNNNIPGAFAEYMHVPNADYNLTQLPEAVGAVEAAGVGCRFMTAFHAISHRADIDGGDSLVVYGTGGVGLSAVHIGAALGAEVYAVDLDSDKLRKAKKLGASHSINAKNTSPVEKIVKDTNGGADVSIDALGSPETCRNSVNSVSKLGTHVQIGLLSQDVELPVRRIQTKEIDFCGSRGMQPSRYEEIFDMVSSGQLSPGEVITETVKLNDVTETLSMMSNYNTNGIHVVDEFK